jgi:hypothetical protein
MKPLALGLAAAALLAPIPARAAASPVEETLADLERIHRAVAQHRQNTGQYPANAAELSTVVLLYARGVAMDGAAPADHWGRRLVYRLRGGDAQPAYELYSLGQNGVDDAGLGDDVVDPARLDRRLYPGLRRAERGALRLFPLLLMLVLAPIVVALLRAARRSAS